MASASSVSVPDLSLRWPTFLVCAGAFLVALFTLLNPEPSRQLSPVARLAFWAAHVGLPLALLQLAQSAVSRVAVLRRLGVWWQCALAGVVGALCFTPLALWMDALFGMPDGQACDAHCFADEFLALAPPVILVWLGLNAARLLRLPALQPQPAPPQTEPKPPRAEPAPATILDRLPAQLGRDVVSLRAELHYLRVETSRGNALILYPFGVAVTEVEPVVPGLQVHRSSWVALSHLVRLEREAGRTVCVMDTGSRIPVGRRRLPEVNRRLGRS